MSVISVLELSADISGFGTSAEIVLSIFSCPSVFSFFFLFLPLSTTTPPNIKARHKTAEIIIKTILLGFKFFTPLKFKIKYSGYFNRHICIHRGYIPESYRRFKHIADGIIKPVRLAKFYF